MPTDPPQPARRETARCPSSGVLANNYTTYVNIGLWESVDHFDKAVGKYIPEAVEEVRPDGRTRYTIEVEGYEFRLRERVVLKIVSDRGGQLPTAKLMQ